MTGACKYLTVFFLLLILARTHCASAEEDRAQAPAATNAATGEDRVQALVDGNVDEKDFRFRVKFNRAYVMDTNAPARDLDPRVIIAKRVKIPPVIDGFLDDECWKAEGPQSEWKHRTQSAFPQVTTLDVSPNQTALFTCYDDKYLYFAYVAEEPRPKAVTFIEKHDTPESSERAEAWRSDCGEIFLETDGLGGNGRMWQFLFNIHPHMFYDGIVPESPRGITWKSGARTKGALGPKQWVVEIAAPFKGFQFDDYAYQGPPKRGEVWGIRTMRNGPKAAPGEQRVYNSWTYNAIEAFDNPWPTGMLIFEDPELVRNNAFNEDLDGDGKLDAWGITESGKGLNAALTFDKQAGLGKISGTLAGENDTVKVFQSLDVRPNKFYKLKARLKIAKGVGSVVVGFSKPAEQATVKEPGQWQTVNLRVLTGEGQDKTTCFILMKGPVQEVLIDSLSVVQDPFGIDESAYCLTGNSYRADKNVRVPWKITGAYTYRDPGTDKYLPPRRQKWTDIIYNGIDDLGAGFARDNWIPFEKGSLTKGGYNVVQWPWNALTVLLSPTYPNGNEIILDLGRDFFVTGIDALFIPKVDAMNVYLKPEKAQAFLLVDKLSGPGVLNPKEGVIYYKLTGADSVARYVKLHFFPHTFRGGSIQMVQIWGKQKGTHADLEVKRFMWKSGLVVKKPDVPMFTRLREPYIVPQPQEVEWKAVPFIITPATKIVCAPGHLTLGIGKDLADDILERYGLEIPVVSLEAERANNSSLTGCIVIGDVFNAPAIVALSREAQLNITPTDPGEQGYGLLVTPERVLVAGSGETQQGAFYGITSLMQIMTKEGGRVQIPGCRIRDWPMFPFRSAMFGWSSYANDGPRTVNQIKRILKLYAMLRLNHVDPYPIRIYPGSMYQEDFLAVDRDLRAYLDRHFMDSGSVDMGGRTPGSPVSVEVGDDEDLVYMKKFHGFLGRLNRCPSSSAGHYAFLGAMDDDLYEKQAPGRFVSFAGQLDEMDKEAMAGSRWNADRRSLKRGLDSVQLFYELLCRDYDFTRLRGLKAEFIDTMLTTDNRVSLYKNMYKAYPFVPHDLVMGMWKGRPGNPESNPEYAVDRFDAAYSWNGFGFHERLPNLKGEVSYNFGNPYGGPAPNYRQTTNKKLWGASMNYFTRGGNQGMVGGLLANITGNRCGMAAACSAVPIYAEYLWSPANPMPTTFAFANRLHNLNVRLNERWFGRPFPSWEDDRQPNWFVVDLGGVANWSHIDKVPFDGEGWLDWGPNYDLRLLPLGETKFEEVPFKIIDPEKNKGRSIIFIANYPDDAKLVPLLPAAGAEIPINRPVASLCFLKLQVGDGNPPVYTATYADGRQLTFILDMRSADGRGWDYGHGYETIKDGGDINNPNWLCNLIDFLSRVGWMGYTGSGDEFTVRIHEWVNPYPELALKSVSVNYLPFQRSGERTAILAITGIAAEDRDLTRWAQKPRPALQTPEAAGALNGLRPLFPKDGVVMPLTNKPDTYACCDGQTNEIARLMPDGDSPFVYDINRRLFLDDGGACLAKVNPDPKQPTVILMQLTKPATVEAVAIRGLVLTRWYNLYYANYAVQVRLGDGTWKEIGKLHGVCGEDGVHVLKVPSLTITALRVVIDFAEYHEIYHYYYNEPGLSFLQVYIRA